MLKATDLLIAPPELPDSTFRSAVILLMSHGTDQGSLGLCVNKTLDLSVSNLDLGHGRYIDAPIYWGGPVSRNTLWMLHSTEWTLNETVELSDSWAMTSNMEMFAAMADGFIPNQFRLFSGYCSWAPGQLDMELAGQHPWNPRHSWLTACSMGPEWMFELPPEDLWASATTLCCHQAVDSWLA